MLGVMHVLDALTASCDGRITVQDAAQAYYESICASADSNSARAGARAKKIFGSPVPSKTYPKQLARRPSPLPPHPPSHLGHTGWWLTTPLLEGVGQPPKGLMVEGGGRRFEGGGSST